MLQDVIDIKIIIDNNSYSNLYFHCKNEIDLQHSNNQDRLGCLYVSTTLQDINLMEIPSISDVYALNGIRIKFLVTKAIIKQSNSLFLLSSNIFTILSFLCQFSLFYFYYYVLVNFITCSAFVVCPGCSLYPAVHHWVLAYDACC